MYRVSIDGAELEIETDSEIFSPAGADRGTLAMLSRVTLGEDEKLLDLGCGAGLVGIWAAKKIGAERVFMTDISEKAVALSRKNAEKNNVPAVTVIQSDGFSALSEKDFTLILSNPPYHEDFSVPKAFIEKGFNRLKIGGRMLMVTKRLDWYKNKLTAIFGGVKVYELDGYFVFEAEKRKAEYDNVLKKMQKKTRRP